MPCASVWKGRSTIPAASASATVSCSCPCCANALERGFDEYFGIPYPNDCSGGEEPGVSGSRYPTCKADFVASAKGESPRGILRAVVGYRMHRRAGRAVVGRRTPSPPAPLPLSTGGEGRKTAICIAFSNFVVSCTLNSRAATVRERLGVDGSVKQ